jgi:GNAT superfamily N-acetyltransferase
MLIRKISVNDLEVCAQILKTAYEKEPYSEKFQDDNALGYIKEKYRSCSEDSFVICEESVVYGFIFWTISCWADGPQAILEEIVIAEGHQGEGLGKKLIKYSDQYLIKNGIKSIMLWAIDDPKVIGFHTRNGYVKSDEYCVMFKNIESNK